MALPKAEWDEVPWNCRLSAAGGLAKIGTGPLSVTCGSCIACMPQAWTGAPFMSTLGICGSNIMGCGGRLGFSALNRSCWICTCTVELIPDGKLFHTNGTHVKKCVYCTFLGLPFYYKSAALLTSFLLLLIDLLKQIYQFISSTGGLDFPLELPLFWTSCRGVQCWGRWNRCLSERLLTFCRTGGVTAECVSRLYT